MNAGAYCMMWRIRSSMELYSGPMRLRPGAWQIVAVAFRDGAHPALTPTIKTLNHFRECALLAHGKSCFDWIRIRVWIWGLVIRVWG
jgi:hypothetical protein